MSQVKIELPNPTGLGSSIIVDGVKQRGVFAFELECTVHQPTKLTIRSHLFEGAVIEGEIDVTNVVICPSCREKREIEEKKAGGC